jgi:hypothetical protein
MVIPRQGTRKLEERAWDMAISRGEAFAKPELARLARIQKFLQLQLSCGELVVAHRQP